MAFQRNAGKNSSCAFVCRTHKKSSTYEHRLCVSNSIRVSAIASIVRDVILNVSRYAIADEESFRKRVMVQALQSSSCSVKACEKRIRTMEKRIAELDFTLRKLYEDSALGRMTEERFDKLSAAYEQEQSELKAALANEQSEFDRLRKQADRTEQFLALARKYRDCTEITDDMIRAFVEKIVVHKTVRSATGQKTRHIEVHLSFIGQFVLPPERGDRTMNNSIFHHRQCERFLLHVVFFYIPFYGISRKRRFHGTEHPGNEDDPPLWPHGL